MNNEHSAECIRCLLELDIEGMRRLHAHLWPHFPQPETNDECLYSMHLARIELKSIPESAKLYSQQWLAERPKGKIVCAVGIAVHSMSSNPNRANNVMDAMSDAVSESIKAGIDIDVEANEVHRRMMIARERERGGRPLIGWQFNNVKVTLK